MGEGRVFLGKGGIFIYEKKSLNSFIVAARVISQGSNSFFKIFFSFENKIENWKRRVKTQVQIKKTNIIIFFSKKKKKKRERERFLFFKKS